MPGCCAINCNNSTRKGYKIYAIPNNKRHPERRKIWLDKINRSSFYPTKSTGICQEHFEADQFEKRIPGKLKPNAIPTIFYKGSSTQKEIKQRSKEATITVPPILASLKQVMYHNYDHNVPSATLVDESTDDSDTPKSTDDVDNLKKCLGKLRRIICTLVEAKKTSESSLGHFLNIDQVESLTRNKNTAINWSESTIERALHLREACGHNGYVVLREQGFPFPSEELLKRRIMSSEDYVETDTLQMLLSRVNTLFEDIGSLSMQDQKIVFKKLRTMLSCHEKVVSLSDKENRTEESGSKKTRTSGRKRKLTRKAEALFKSEQQNSRLTQPCIVKVVRLDPNSETNYSQTLDSSVTGLSRPADDIWEIRVQESLTNEGTDSDAANDESEPKVHLDNFFRCSLCDFTSTVQSSVVHHQLTHNEEFVSELCTKVFSQKERLDVHLKRHSGLKILECALCDFHSGSNIDMIKHMSKHIGEKPNLCNETPYSVRKVTALTFNKVPGNTQKVSDQNDCSLMSEVHNMETHGSFNLDNIKKDKEQETQTNNTSFKSKEANCNLVLETRDDSLEQSSVCISSGMDFSKPRNTGPFDVLSEAIQTLSEPVQDNSGNVSCAMEGVSESANVPFGIPSDLFVIELVHDDNDPH